MNFDYIGDINILGAGNSDPDGDYLPWYGENDIDNPTENDSFSMSANCSEYQEFLNEMNKYVAPSQFAIPIVFCVICFIGLIGNGLVMFVIFGSKEMTKTVANIYIWNLAVADTLLLLSLPFSSTQRFLDVWPFGIAMCKIVESVKYLNMFASVFFLTAMSIDRYIAVVYVVSSSKWRTSRNTFFICMGIWVVSLVMVVPLLIHTKTHGGVCGLVFPDEHKRDLWKLYDYMNIPMDYNDFKDCDDLYTYGEVYDDDFAVMKIANKDNVPPGRHAGVSSGDYNFEQNKNMRPQLTDPLLISEEYVACDYTYSRTLYVYLIFTFVIGFVIPFVIITICYSMIIVKLLRPSETRSRSKQAEKTRKKVTRMVVALVVTFFVCWLPFYIWHLLKLRKVEVPIGMCQNFDDATFVLGYLNSVLNPILYTFLGHNFQERLRKSIAISLRSFSFTTFTRFTTNTISRAETVGAHSRKMDVSNSEQVADASVKINLCSVKEEETTTRSTKLSTSSANAKLIEEKET